MSKLSLVLSFAALLALSAEADAKGWQICNRTGENLDVAIAYRDSEDKWISKGWHNLRACGGCALVMNHSRTEYTDVYFHARTTSSVERFGGDARFCVSNGVFTMRNGARCGAGATVASFRKQVITNDDRNFTTNLNGRGCID